MVRTIVKYVVALKYQVDGVDAGWIYRIEHEREIYSPGIENAEFFNTEHEALNSLDSDRYDQNVLTVTMEIKDK